MKYKAVRTHRTIHADSKHPLHWLVRGLLDILRPVNRESHIKAKLQRVCRRVKAPPTAVGSGKNMAVPTWERFLSHSRTIDLTPLRCASVHRKEVILFRRIKLAVERVVCVICGC